MRRKVRSIFYYPGIFATVIGVTFIPLYVYPKLYEKELRAAQVKNRGYLNNIDTQPGNMKQWSDPFKSKDNDLVDQD